MRKFIIGAIAAIGVCCVGLLTAGMLLDTQERATPSILPGFYQSTVAVPHRNTPLPIYVWYPAEQVGEPELVGQNGLFYGEYVLKNAPAIPALSPIVFTSHGSGGNGRQISWLARELVANGMIVVATDHLGTTSGDSDPFQTINVWERPEDISRLLDQLASNAPNGMNVDIDNVAALGFSLGGHTALSLAGLQVSKQQYISYCDANPAMLDCGWMLNAGVNFEDIDQPRYEQSNRDSRIKAAVSIDPALPQAATAESLAAYQVPTLLINLGSELPAAIRADQIASKMAGSTYYIAPKTHHFGFLMECSTLGKVIIGLAGDDNICSDHGYRDRAEVHREIAPVISAFLKQTLFDIAPAS